jgi:hypothetical protein
LKGLSAKTKLAAIRELGGVSRLERGDGMLRLFVKRAANLLEPLQKILARDKSMRSRIAPISLEDLFFHLTRREGQE